LADSDYVYNAVMAKIKELKQTHNIKGNCETIVNNERSLAIVKGGRDFIKFEQKGDDTGKETVQKALFVVNESI
jgi:hypothetical protein